MQLPAHLFFLAVSSIGISNENQLPFPNLLSAQTLPPSHLQNAFGVQTRGANHVPSQL
jgi:hypothetical protein